MSWSELYVQGHRRRTDCAIHRAYAQLASDPFALAQFGELLLCARRRAPRLFEAPFVDGHHLGVEALVNLCRFRESHVRPVIDWPGTSSSWRSAISSLAHHLVCRYRVPAFLSSSWHATGASGDKKRVWFVKHSRGVSFRTLDLPVAMTRKMEHIFLSSHDHLSIEQAIRRAELIALGASPGLVSEVFRTRLATELSDSEFWRSVWLFLTANVKILESRDVGPLIDYIQAVRRHRPQDGLTAFGSPQAAFSMKGRTLQSMLRLMRDWHRSLGQGSATYAWRRSQFEPLVLTEQSRDASEAPRRWEMIELTNSAQLRGEGAALHHCVASYADRCYRGVSSIWSLRFWQEERIHHVLTIEVDPKKHAVVQARGRANRLPSGRPLRFIQDWAVREKLRMTI